MIPAEQLTRDVLEAAAMWMDEGAVSTVSIPGDPVGVRILADAEIDVDELEELSRERGGLLAGSVLAALAEIPGAREQVITAGLSTMFKAGALAMLKALTDLDVQDGDGRAAKFKKALEDCRFHTGRGPAVDPENPTRWDGTIAAIRGEIDEVLPRPS